MAARGRGGGRGIAEWVGHTREPCARRCHPTSPHPPPHTQTHNLALTTLLALTSALAAAPLFGAARGGVVGYNQRWAFQRGTNPVSDLYSTSAGYAGYSASRGTPSSGDLWDLNRAAGGVGTALGCWLGAAAAAAAAAAILALFGRARGPSLLPLSIVLGGGLLATLAVFYAIVGLALARAASSDAALGKRPPIWPNWGWITGALSGIGWLLAPLLARGLGEGPPGGVCSTSALDGGADDTTAAAVAAKLAAAERGEGAGGLPPSTSARSGGGGGGGGGLTAAAAATTAAAGAAAAAARRTKPAAGDDAPKPAAGGGEAGTAPPPQKSGSFLSRAFSRGGSKSEAATVDEEAAAQSGAPASSDKIKRLFSRSASVVEAESAAHVTTTAALAKAGLPPPSAGEAASLAAVAAEAQSLQDKVDAVVTGAAAAAAADLADAKATAVELKRALTLELAPGQLPGGGSDAEALAAGAVAAADAARRGDGVQGAASSGAAAYETAKGKAPA